MWELECSHYPLRYRRRYLVILEVRVRTDHSSLACHRVDGTWLGLRSIYRNTGIYRVYGGCGRATGAASRNGLPRFAMLCPRQQSVATAAFPATRSSSSRPLVYRVMLFCPRKSMVSPGHVLARACVLDRQALDCCARILDCPSDGYRQ
jgi:hypothetical protein